MEQQIEDFIQELDWDYSYDTEKYYFSSRKDWNQTLITKINNAGAILFRFNNNIQQLQDFSNKNLRVVKKSVVSPKKYIDIFKSMEYYNDEDRKIGNRFDVGFHDNQSEDFIVVSYIQKNKQKYSVKINILNFI